jgi:divalent metal cation (Fe/Co/Zn/Cd) transporter
MLSLLSIGWMTVEAGAAIVAALFAGSVALLGFGLDSLIELTSASTILWLYTGSRGGSATAERRAQKLIATCFAVLALYVTLDAINTLAGGRHPNMSWLGVAVTVGAIVFMPLLGRAKGSVARQLGSAATAGDAAQSWLCAIIAAAALVSLLANSALGWWWLDPIAGLVIAGLAVLEGREAWQGDACADCKPIGFGRVSSVAGPQTAHGDERESLAERHRTSLPDPAIALHRNAGPDHLDDTERPHAVQEGVDAGE